MALLKRLPFHFPCRPVVMGFVALLETVWAFEGSMETGILFKIEFADGH